MGRMYAASFNAVAVTAAQDFFELVAPSDAAVVVHSLCLGQSSDAGDAEDEQLNLLISRSAGGGSGGSTVTPSPMNVGDAAFGGTCEANNTTQATPGVALHSDAFNIRAGYQVWWTPETRPVLSPSGGLLVELTGAPGDSLTMSGTMVLEEIGG